MKKNYLIADEKTVLRSIDPKNLYCYTPAIFRGKNRRLIAGWDYGGTGVPKLDGPITNRIGDWASGNQCRVMVSDDDGETWRVTGIFAMYHAILFEANGRLCLLGTNHDLVLSVSEDNGETWSELITLNNEHKWFQSGFRVCHMNGNIYISFEISLETEPPTWPDSAPVLIAVKEDADLKNPASWRYSKPFDPRPVIAASQTLGVPFYDSKEHDPSHKKDTRWCGQPGILESNVIEIKDPRHAFYDPDHRSVLVFLRAHTAMINIGAVLHGVDKPDGTLALELLKTPSGRTLFYIPLPGGQMKFDLDYDPVSKSYWMVSTQAADSMCRPECLADDRYGIPDNERRRLVLHFSKDAWSWCFAGVIAEGKTEGQARHYANMQIDGNDIIVLSRSGDEQAASTHNTNLLTLHRIRNFRELIY